MYLLVFHAYINEMHGSRSKIPSKKSRPYIYDIKFLALLGTPYTESAKKKMYAHFNESHLLQCIHFYGGPCIYISRLRVNVRQKYQADMHSWSLAIIGHNNLDRP